MQCKVIYFRSGTKIDAGISMKMTCGLGLMEMNKIFKQTRQ